jgi:hypothetical protein
MLLNILRTTNAIFSLYEPDEEFKKPTASAVYLVVVSLMACIFHVQFQGYMCMPIITSHEGP